MQKGFTLVELTITIGILGIVSTVLALIWANFDTTFYIQQSKNALQRETRSALDSVNSWTKKSAEVVSIWTAPDLAEYATDSSEIILKVQAIDANNNLIALTYDYVIFKADNAESNKLKRLIYADAASSRNNSTAVYSDNLNSLNFTFYDPGGVELIVNYENTVLIKTNIITQEVVRGTTNQVNLTTETKIRNK